MFYFHCIALVFLFIFPVTFFGCDDNVSPVNKGGNVNHKDTSIFYGTWVSVFDTSDNPPGDKESKLMHWCKDFLLGLGECATPDTFTMNDSIMESHSSGFQYYYRYSSDSLYFYTKLVGTNDLVFESSESYVLSNDTLYSGPDTTYIGGTMYVYFPVFFRICDTIIPPKVIY